MHLNDAHLPVRVRFAPAPTGHLHVGSFRTALFNWAFARHHRGVFLLRIEDTDTERSLPEYTNSIIKSLEWADLMPDEPPLVQTSRQAQHVAVAHTLLQEGKAYRCYCTQQELAQRCLRAENAGEESFFLYDKKCRFQKPADTNKPFVIRFAVPESSAPFVFHDLIRGDITIDRTYIDDFIIVRSDGRPIYNFVVVVDDAFMCITHVIRGEDHISNTPKQILLYQACGYQIPQFAHLPMILGPGGNKLSKRDGAISILEYQQDGYLPQALENYLMRLGWSHGDQEIFTREELIQYFSLDQVGKKGAVFDLQKLDWFNTVYIKQKSAVELFFYMHQFVMPDIKDQLHTWDNDTIYRAIDMYKDRIKTVRQLGQELITLAHGPSLYDQHDLDRFINADSAALITILISELSKTSEWTVDKLTALLHTIAQNRQIKFVELARPLRLALIGKAAGPGVIELLLFVGKQQTIAHLHQLHQSIAK